MSEIIFNNKSEHPSAKQLADALGKNYKHWQTIKDYVNKNYEPITDEWKFYGKNYGWQLKTLLKKRNLFFLIPYKSYFKIVFVFGDKAVKEIEKSSVSENLITELLNAKKYAEGRGLPIDVNSGKYISDIKKMIKIKISN
ncbi:DUF3788 family protein [Bacteroidota bacterium]